MELGALVRVAIVFATMAMWAPLFARGDETDWTGQRVVLQREIAARDDPSGNEASNGFYWPAT